MKDIKFRAWDKELKKMFYQRTLEQFDDSLLLRFSHFEDEEPIYMQYTGLKDIKGKEIYEGDIIKYHRHQGAYYESEVINKIGVIVWEDDKCSFKIKHNGGDTEKLFTSHCVEVIGNIYENPELLEWIK
jgi:uncharacterized phage protein (TIGR01671 family)